ncbi:MAG: aminotransferase, partial [Balneolaceae bacterium]
MSTRKDFIRTIGAGAAAISFGSFFNPIKASEIGSELRSMSGSPLDIAGNEEFWFRVQQAFTVDRSLINLNNGGVSPSPE